MRESEFEMESEFESEFEGEGEEFLGTIARGIGGLFGGQGEGEFEFEYEGEGEYELEGEFEGEYEGEEFFRRIARGIGGFVRRAAPVLRRVARVAAPLVATAVGGPVAGMAARGLVSALGEGEMEFEGEGEFELEGEGEMEFEGEGEFEGEFEAQAAPVTASQALAEYMAAISSRVQNEAEAEAMVGAAAVSSISPADRAALRRVLPHLVRGTAILTRVLRRRRLTRPAVRAVPTILNRTTQTLARRAASGQPVTRRTAARVMANQTRRVLGSPRTCARAIQRNVRATRAVTRSNAQRPRRPARVIG